MYESMETGILERLAGQKISVVGDGRYCTSGHSAKFSNYGLMMSDTNELVTQNLSQVT